MCQFLALELVVKEKAGCVSNQDHFWPTVYCTVETVFPFCLEWRWECLDSPFDQSKVWGTRWEMDLFWWTLGFPVAQEQTLVQKMLPQFDQEESVFLCAILKQKKLKSTKFGFVESVLRIFDELIRLRPEFLPPSARSLFEHSQTNTGKLPEFIFFHMLFGEMIRTRVNNFFNFSGVLFTVYTKQFSNVTVSLSKVTIFAANNNCVALQLSTKDRRTICYVTRFSKL